MSIKLRELIRLVRACKTAAEERAVIQKECAEIRTALKDEDNPFRHRNLAKLLYISMLGYPTHFGQVECLKLIASSKFPEKRIGYLGMTILLDETQEVLMLVTNTLKRDLNQDNPYVTGLALAAFGNVCSPEMARDLASEIEKLLHDGNPYIKKKAALCAVRAVRKAPELLEDFINSVQDLILDKNHGPVLGGVALATQMLLTDANAVRKKFLAMLPDVLRVLKNLVVSGYSPEHDIAGITDPFLQAKLIRFLRLLMEGATKPNEDLNDLLAQVATNTEGAKNPGNTILYECVQTIMSIPAESALRVMAINILGRFLLNRDNNIRYVALNTLFKCGKGDAKAIQKHRNTIVDCLKDPDVSIRKRALNLIYSLVNKANVKALVKELVNYLELASGDPDFRTDLTDKVTTVAKKFAPEPLWFIDTLIRVLQAAGNITKESVVADLVLCIQQNKDLHAYSVYKLFLAAKTHSQPALVNVAAWAIGEYGNLLCTADGLEAANAVSTDVKFVRISEDEVLSVLDKLLYRVGATNVNKQYILTAFIKLSTRFSESSQRHISGALKAFTSNMALEVQSRACEYFNFIDSDYVKLRQEIFKTLPALDLEAIKKRKAEEEDEELESPVPSDVEDVSASDTDDSRAASPVSPVPPAKPEKIKKPKTVKPVASPPPIEKQASSELIDLTDLFSTTATSRGSVNFGAATAGTDLLESLFASSAKAPAKAATPAGEATGSSAVSHPFSGPAPSTFSLFGVSEPKVAAPSSAPTQGFDPTDILSVLSPAAVSTPVGFSTPTAAPAAPVSFESKEAFPPAVAFENEDFQVKFHFQKSVNGVAMVTMKTTSKVSSSITNFKILIAVPPSYIKLKMIPASGTTVGASGITQDMELTNIQYGKKPYQVRLKIEYELDGVPKTCTGDFKSFPADI